MRNHVWTIWAYVELPPQNPSPPVFAGYEGKCTNGYIFREETPCRWRIKRLKPWSIADNL